MKLFQGLVISWLALLPCILGFPSESETVHLEAEPTSSAAVGTTPSTLNETSNSIPEESSTESALTTLPPLPDATTTVPPVLSNGTAIDGNNSTTTVGNNTVTVIGNNTIIVSRPGNEITVNVLPGGGIAVNVSRPGQNISINPDGTIVHSGGPHKSQLLQISESVAFGKPEEFNIPPLNLPLIAQLQHRRRNRFPFGSLGGIRNFDPISASSSAETSNPDFLDFPMNPEPFVRH